jgi:hypothetical protein
MLFYRGTFTHLLIRLESSVAIGVLDVTYVQDYFGANGQLTIQHLDSGQRFVVPMVVAGDDKLQGTILFADIPNGDYQIQGRIRNTSDEYFILTVVQTPLGGEEIIESEFEVSGLFGYTTQEIRIDPATLTGGYRIAMAARVDQHSVTIPDDKTGPLITL